VASLHYNRESQYCAVLLKLKEDFANNVKPIDPYMHCDEEISSTKAYPYRLQVWSEAGQMIFEQPLQAMPESWNMHTNKTGCDFVFEIKTEQNFADEFTYLELHFENQQYDHYSFRVEYEDDEYSEANKAQRKETCNFEPQGISK